MSDPVSWFHTGRLLLSSMFMAALGIHAFCLHKHEAMKTVSVRRWAYWFYAVIFLVACVSNFAVFIIAIASRSYGNVAIQLGVLTLLLAISYAALLAGAGRSILK